MVSIEWSAAERSLAIAARRWNPKDCLASSRFDKGDEADFPILIR